MMPVAAIHMPRPWVHTLHRVCGPHLRPIARHAAGAALAGRCCSILFRLCARVLMRLCSRAVACRPESLALGGPVMAQQEDATVDLEISIL